MLANTTEAAERAADVLSKASFPTVFPHRPRLVLDFGTSYIWHLRAAMAWEKLTMNDAAGIGIKARPFTTNQHCSETEISLLLGLLTVQRWRMALCEWLVCIPDKQACVNFHRLLAFVHNAQCVCGQTKINRSQVNLY